MFDNLQIIVVTLLYMYNKGFVSKI